VCDFSPFLDLDCKFKIYFQLLKYAVLLFAFLSIPSLTIAFKRAVKFAITGKQFMAIGPQSQATKAGSLLSKLYVQVLIAIAGGIALGVARPEFAAELKPLGDAFIALVKMIIAPVIFLTVTVGIGSMGKGRRLGTVIGRAMAYFLAVSTLALVIGLVVGNIVQPGAGMNIDPKTLDASAVAKYANQSHDMTIIGFLMNVIPKTPVSALASGDILQVLFVSVLFGLSITWVGAPAAPFLAVLESANKVVFAAVHALMKFAPIGAFGAMAFTIGKFGLASLTSLALLVGTFYGTSFLFVLIVLGTIAHFSGFSIIRLIVYLKDELWLVLGTSSSEAALPSVMEKLEQAGCKKEVVGVVLPTGYSFNLDGTNIYMTLASLFIAQAVGVELSLTDQLLLVGVAVISSKGAAGVTGAGFIILATTLSVVPTVPVAGMALILGVDRFMSECRALTNFIGNAVATIVVAGWEGALDRVALARALSGDIQQETEADETAPMSDSLARTD
jgi:aerobic C4-dicarboxylate transport protein